MRAKVVRRLRHQFWIMYQMMPPKVKLTMSSNDWRRIKREYLRDRQTTKP